MGVIARLDRGDQGDRAFEFRAARYREWRSAPDGASKGKLTLPHTATYVIEESIKQGTLKANLSAAEYRELKQNIKDGMWVAETMGGGALRDIPDFRLEFVNRTEDAPKCPPRPTSQRDFGGALALPREYDSGFPIIAHCCPRPPPRYVRSWRELTLHLQPIRRTTQRNLSYPTDRTPPTRTARGSA
jgi:hypothetical protein